MEKNIFIGCEKTKVPCWRTYSWGDIGVSHNDLFYTIEYNKSSPILIHIYKESRSGIEFKTWLDDTANQNKQSIEHKYLELLFFYGSINDFNEFLDRERELARKEGYADAQYNIRKALGLVASI